MLRQIKFFLFAILALLLASMYAIFADYYLDQREKTAYAIVESLKNDMSEMSYLLSKNIKDIGHISRHRSLLERAVSYNDFIHSIIIHDDAHVLLKTDPFFKHIPSKSSLFSSKLKSSYNRLVENQWMEGGIRFYDGVKFHNLSLLFVLDHDEIALHFNESQIRFIISFGILPLIILVLIWLIFRHYITRPLERLRQYAYYQSEIPKSFRIKELEAIRSSMVQTISRLESEQKELYEISRKDSLSGLANRHALHEYLDRRIADAKRYESEFAFLFLDLDHFKDVNDELGHDVGDELLKNVASVIQGVLRYNDFVARVGGDEFVIILHHYRSMSELIQIIERIQQRLNETWTIQTHPINITSSIGIAFYPKDGHDFVTLMKNADIAMYEAKHSGRNQFHFFTEELNQKVQDNIALDKAMRQALISQHYELFYQPKVHIPDNTIIGAEALIRWRDPDKGIISPDTFIPLAEENGFIIELGDWVLKEALRQQLSWNRAGIDIKISVNLSAHQLCDPLFEEKLTQLLKEYPVNPQMLDFEITEYLLFKQNQTNIDILNKISDMGITISLDDFGTGYSSLSYLKLFPIDCLKIDKVFMDDYHTAEGATFLETIIKMGQTLKIRVIAEGVEDAKQLEYLQSIGCDIYQGYHFSKPLESSAFEALYRTHQ